MSTSKHIVIEEQKKVIPSVLFIDTNKGDYNPLLHFLINSLKHKVKPYVLSVKSIPESAERISVLSIHFLDKLNPPLEYAVLFLDDESQKDKTLEIIGKLELKRTRIIVLVPYRKNQVFVDVFISCKDTPNISFVLLGDVYGKHINNTPVANLIQDALKYHSLQLQGNELTPIFPISEEDTTRGIEYILFGANEPSYFYNLFYSAPQTIISLAHVIKRVEPELSISLKEGKSILPQQKTQQQNETFLKSRVGIKPTSLSSVFLGFEKSLRSISAETSKVEKKRKSKVKRVYHTSKIKRVLAFLLTGFVLYVIISFMLFGISVLYFKFGLTDLVSGNVTASSNKIKISYALYEITQIPVNGVADSLSFVFPPVSQTISLYQTALSQTNETMGTIKTIQSSYSHLKKDDLVALTSSLTQIYFLSQRTDLPNMPQLEKENATTASKFLSLLSILPSALGFDHEKNYLVLFQNDNELRPTGGFIGSVGELTVKNGNLENVNIQDVYALDGQLKGHIEPHYIIRRFLQPHLYLRDSNFDPSFDVSASRSASLYNLETGRQVDGVFAIDTQVLKTLVDIVGPVSIPGIKEKITGENVSALLHESIHDNFFPGSTEKKDTLSTLFNKIVIGLETNPRMQAEFIKNLPSLISQKHMLFSFADPSIESAFRASSFAGSLYDTRTRESTVADFLSVNEANIGVNKINSETTRKVSYVALLKDSEVDSDVSVDIKNSGGEDYKNYLRIIVPEKAELLQINIDGNEQKIVSAVTNYNMYERPGFKAPIGLEVDQEVEDGKKIIGFITTVPQKKSQRIHILYRTPFRTDASGSLTYSLLYIKQPGTLPYPLTVQVIPGRGLTAKDTALNSQLIYDKTIVGDTEISAEFLQKK